jgi:CO dehydrogenase/acetyl-CoA synthase epsilon subunit
MCSEGCAWWSGLRYNASYEWILNLGFRDMILSRSQLKSFQNFGFLVQIKLSEQRKLVHFRQMSFKEMKNLSSSCDLDNMMW